MYAIKIIAIGKEPGVRHVKEEDHNADFHVEHYKKGMVVSEDGISLRDKTQQEVDEEQTLEDTESQRLSEIKEEQDSFGFKRKSVAWAHNKIDKIFEGATTAPLLRTACVKAFKMLSVFILK